MEKKTLPPITPTSAETKTGKKRGRKKKVIPDFKITSATEDKPIVVKFD